MGVQRKARPGLTGSVGKETMSPFEIQAAYDLQGQSKDE